MHKIIVWFICLNGMFLLGGCKGNDKTAKKVSINSATNPNVVFKPPTTTGFQPLSIDAYSAKVKNILTGDPLDDDEISSIENNPNQLKYYIGLWSQTSQAQAKWQTFFTTVFQQNLVSEADFKDQTFYDCMALGLNYFGANSPLLMQNLTQSFGLTAVEILLKQNQPLTSLLTTQSFMMTLPMMMYYAELDEQMIDDQQNPYDFLNPPPPANPNFAFTIQSYQTVSLSDTLNPNSHNFMVWNAPGAALQLTSSNVAINPPPTNPNSWTIGPNTARDNSFMVVPELLRFLLGGGFDYKVSGARYSSIYGKYSLSPNSYIVASDFNNWRMVNIRLPNQGESITKFYDLTTLRNTNTLVLNIPRIGFFSTPAFFASYQTNTSNQARVLMNQTMIVALGKAFDGTDTTVPANTNALDGNHANELGCALCHLRLDPMRQYFRQAYSLHGHQQTDPNQINIPSAFAFFESSSTMGTGLVDLANQLTNHPLFASAWVQKLCAYVNSAPCDETDPEFQRIVQVFQQSDYKWNVLVQELFSSPIVTYASPTQSTQANGPVISIARQEHFCSALSNRLNIQDICGLNVATQEPIGLSLLPTMSVALPADAYSRGNVNPLLVTNPGFIVFADLENICLDVANQVVDATDPVSNQVMFDSSEPNQAIINLVATVMGITQSRAAAPTDFLQIHYNNALALTSSPTLALQSTFMVACLSPSSIAIGF